MTPPGPGIAPTSGETMIRTHAEQEQGLAQQRVLFGLGCGQFVAHRSNVGPVCYKGKTEVRCAGEVKPAGAGGFRLRSLRELWRMNPPSVAVRASVGKGRKVRACHCVRADEGKVREVRGCHSILHP